jgi:hypothetical protein
METPTWLEWPPADTLPPANPSSIDPDGAHALAEAIVDTIREPLLVLDKDLCVVTANRSFYLTFVMKRKDVEGRHVYALGDGQWNIPELRLLRENIAPQHAVMDAYEVEQDFSGIGRRTAEPNWRLTVADNGIGQPEGHSERTNPGLGTTIIEALAKQLDARVEVLRTPWAQRYRSRTERLHAPVRRCLMPAKLVLWMDYNLGGCLLSWSRRAPEPGVKW